MKAANQSARKPDRWPATAAFLCSLVFGASLFSICSSPHAFACGVIGISALTILLFFPELALALYIVIGDLKGDDRIAALLPVDLTLALGGVLVAGILLNLLRGKRVAQMPHSYLCFVALVALMLASLAYTPAFDAGLDKLGRFVSVTSIVIVAPFFVLSTIRAMKRFLIALGIAAMSICAWSLLALGGSDRLVTPSDNTIGLGHIACAAIILMWFALIPRLAFPWRLFLYPLVAIPGIALIGSGSRGSAIACGAVILASLFFYRARWLDLACFAGLGIVALPFLNIPASSFEYLGTLIRSHSTAELLSFRSDLLDSAWRLLQAHPLIGGGIQSFRYYSPIPGVYNWPHNIFLEIACELGIPAALLACVIFASAIREAVRQVRDKANPYFVFSEIAVALLAVGIINGVNTGDINSDRSTWLFVSLIFAVGSLRRRATQTDGVALESARLEPA